MAKNQTKAIRIILTGTHEQMMKIAQEGKLGNWIDANLKWLRETFGSENLVSCVLHMDEKTPHLHATVVPIVTTERLRKKREGEKKYETKSGPRLSADDVMRRSKLHEYQNSYAAAMKSFGLHRGIVGSTARHQANSEYYKQQISRYEEDITKLQVDIEKAQEGKSTILSWFGKGDLAKAKKELAEKDELIAKLKDRIRTLKAEKAQLQERHKSEMERLRNGYQKEIDKAISRAEVAERQSKEKDSVIDRQKLQCTPYIHHFLLFVRRWQRKFNIKETRPIQVGSNTGIANEPTITITLGSIKIHEKVFWQNFFIIVDDKCCICRRD